jgi:NADH-quinone oxidoreductase subunit D
VSIKTEPMIVNIGPQHPSTHGVFRMRVTLDGELITDAEMVVGYLHRSMEKLAEERTWTQNIPFTDRMDYLAAMTGNLSYCLAVERLAGIEVPERGQYLRVLFAELQRIASHAMANGTFINDCGAWQTPLFYMFREREKILDLFEMVCGARLTLNYMRIGGVAFDVPDEFMPRLQALVDELPDRIDEYEQLLLEN